MEKTAGKGIEFSYRMIAMPKPKEHLSPAIVYPTATSIDRSSSISKKRDKNKSRL
jgi:hypothetical protein